MNEDLKNAAQLLKEYCSNRACCEGCTFKRKPTYTLQECCKIGYPEEWSIRKDKKDAKEQ